MRNFKIIETDNFGRDYPDEKFLNIPPTTNERAKKIADAINDAFGGAYASRYWMVVPYDYKLEGGFEA